MTALTLLTKTMAAKQAKSVTVFGVDRGVLPTDPVRLSLQTIVELAEEVSDPAKNSGRVPSVAYSIAALHALQPFRLLIDKPCLAAYANSVNVDGTEVPVQPGEE
jgi:hypothetical protein